MYPTLTALEAELHFGNSVMRASPIRFRLCFSNDAHLTLSIAGSGDRITLDHRELFSAEMAEFGKTVVQDVALLVTPRLLGAQVQSINELWNNDRKVGISLHSQYTTFHLWVDCDEWFWGNALDLDRHQWSNGKAALPGNGISLT